MVRWLGTLLFFSMAARALSAPLISASNGRTMVTGAAYRLSFREGEGAFDLALKQSDGSFRVIGRAGGSLTLGFLTASGEEHLDGRRATWKIVQKGSTVVVGEASPLGVAGNTVVEMHYICTDDGILVGARVAKSQSQGALLPLPRLALDPSEWTEYAFHAEDGQLHTGHIDDLGPPSSYAGVSPWGTRGDTVARLDAQRPAIGVFTKDGTGLAAVFLDYARRWRNASAFVQRYTAPAVLFYPAYAPLEDATERMWCWLAPMRDSRLDALRIADLLRTGAELTTSFEPVAPPVPNDWFQEVGDFPDRLRRTATVRDIREAVVYTMNESTVSEDALDLARKAGSEVMIRGWFKWANAPDLSRVKHLPAKAHAFGALFGGGITCSALYDTENGITHEQLLDMATRGPDGELVDAWGQKGVRHGSLSSPAYLDYLFRWCKEQIDAGADVLFMDEHTAALAANEGFDDHSVADFRAFLLEKLGWPPTDRRWQDRGIPLDDPAVCSDGTMRTFNYRALLRTKGHTDNPWSPENPLARLYAEFRERRDVGAWHSLTSRIRTYAASLGRRVLVNANGFAPEVDLQVAGVWNDTMMRDGRIDLTEDGIPRWRQRIRNGQRVAGKPVPVVLFHDWGFGDTPFPFLSMPVNDRDLWIRIRGAEIYAAGGFFAFPVLGPFGCNAARDGTLRTIQRQAIFYRTHRHLYTQGHYVGCHGPKTADERLSLAVWQLSGGKTVAIHVINRAVEDGRLLPRVRVRITLPTPTSPVSARAVSPDWDGAVPVQLRRLPGGVEVTLLRLEAYAVVLVDFRRHPDLRGITEPARITLEARWERPRRSEFRVGHGGVVDGSDDIPGMLQGRLHTHMRNPPTFLVDATAGATLRIKVGAVATLGARVEVRLDGKVLAAVDLPDRDGLNDSEAPEYDRVLTFRIPRGRHRVTLDNSGGDWVRLRWLEWSVWSH